MKYIFNIGPDGDVMQVRSPFSKLQGEAGATYSIEGENRNYLIFMISGNMKVVNGRNASTIMEPQYMYSVCSVCAPYSFEALSDFSCLVFLADTLANHVNARNLMKILSSEFTMCEGLPGLKYNELFESFIQNILLVNDYKDLMPDSFYDIKKSELLHYITNFYTHEEIVSLIYGIVSTYSDFKRKVYANYNNSINVQQLADSMHMTTKTFTRNFKKEFNMTPNDWILEQRLFNLNHSKVNKGMPLSNLLEEFGFASTSAFRQFCKRYEVEHLVEFLKEDKAI